MTVTSNGSHVDLRDLRAVLAELEYPCRRETVVDRGGDITVRLADGTINLGDLMEESNDDVYDSIDDLSNEILSLLPRRAVGEPYQSEGDA